MASRPQREALTESARQRTGELRGWFVRRFAQPVQRLLNAIVMRLPASRVLYRIGKPVALFGFICTAAWPLTSLISVYTTGFHLPTTEFPLGDPRDVAVDSQGRFYVVDSLHMRVQRYSPDGEFERGWLIPRKVFAVR